MAPGEKPPRERRPGPAARETETFDSEEAATEQAAVEKFDQQGDQSSPDAEQIPDNETEGGDDAQSSGKGAMSLMEQWLQQAEGNPAYLMRNQFMLEEQRAISKRSVPLREPRPW